MKREKKLLMDSVFINHITDDRDQTYIILQNEQGFVYPYEIMKDLHFELGETLKQMKPSVFNHIIEEVQADLSSPALSQKETYGNSEFPIQELNIQKAKLYETDSILAFSCKACQKSIQTQNCTHYYLMHPTTEFPYIFEYKDETTRACSKACITELAQKIAQQAIKDEYQSFFDPIDFKRRIATYVKSL